MAIQVTNFNPVWKYENNSSINYSDGTFIFVNCETVNKNSINIRATIYNQDPSISGTKLRGQLNYSLIPMNVEDNLLLVAHDYLITQLTALNPDVTFTKVNLVS
jgi:hypothetical protein